MFAINISSSSPGKDLEGSIAPPPETYESIFIRHDFVQFGKQHSRYKAILLSIVLSQKSCEIIFICLTVVNLQ